MSDPVGDSAMDAFFAPRSIAVVGASARPSSVGYALLRNLLFGRIREGNGDGGVNALELLVVRGGWGVVGPGHACRAETATCCRAWRETGVTVQPHGR